MGVGHAHPLYRAGDSVVHRAPTEVKLVCLVVFVFAVVATPREMFWPYAVYAAILFVVWRCGGIGVRWILPRMLIEAPFVVLAVLLPFAEGGQRIDVAGLSLSVAGLYAAWGIVIKGTLGVAASLTFAATTPARELPLALTRLGMPGTLSPVIVMMLRYTDLLSAEIKRMHIARLARGDSPRMLHQASAIAKGVGALFLRSYERGERVHLAMMSRGFTGSVPEMPGVATAPRATAGQWVTVALPALVAVMVAVIAWGTR
ncbi:cobalt ECF transporter T component CbiQ [Gordonia insulae]|uniref:Energy-coupling factor transporter transmembrane protein EcfT n=1 Tax=Gordonia insulae TaxID=2420509 RepID=A0A3G8JIH6_9ACTN|nr:cobalt ECF transporter T component CbiQ [Gordonia insulae]AZG44738.1 Energy-coupling factor transporter transmembrane protein EcfT [Gordonia insulae]